MIHPVVYDEWGGYEDPEEESGFDIDILELLDDEYEEDE